VESRGVTILTFSNQYSAHDRDSPDENFYPVEDGTVWLIRHLGMASAMSLHKNSTLGELRWNARNSIGVQKRINQCDIYVI
jgi:hypothetical protein